MSLESGVGVGVKARESTGDAMLRRLPSGSSGCEVGDDDPGERVRWKGEKVEMEKLGKEKEDGQKRRGERKVEGKGERE